MSNHPRTSVRQAGFGTATPTATSGSQTALQTEAGSSIPIPTLRLRAERDQRRHIQWAEDVVDNEGMGKKSSKVCCIYNKPHEPGDSDSDSDSSSDDESDAEPDLSKAQRAGGRGKRSQRGRKQDGGKGQGKDDGKERKASPNAYERQPKHKNN